MLAGELPGDVEKHLSAHVDTCGLCQQVLEQLTAFQPDSEPSPPAQPAPGVSGTDFLSAERASRVGSGQRLSDSQLHRLRGLLPPSVPALSGNGAPRAVDWPAIPGYDIVGEMGRGGMAVVYQARHLRLNRPVALKMIRAGELANPEQLVRFCTEGQIIARLRHPNIVQIYEVGSHDRQPYLALELMEGGSLDEAQGGRPLPARAAAELVETLARAMDYAHRQGIVHRDLKPANILLAGVRSQVSGVRGGNAGTAALTPDPFLLTPKITDFGLAKYLDTDSRLTKTGHAMGTPNYMAPEQVRGQADRVGPRTDVYSLGTILYELLTGRPPFQAPTSLEVMNQVAELDPVPPSRLLPQVPRDLEVIGLKCLEKEPARRFASALELADDLHRFLGGEPIRARRVHTLERAWRWARRRPAVSGLLLVVLLMAVLGFAGVFWQWRQAESARLAAVESAGALRQERDHARWQAYLANLKAASSALSNQNVNLAQAALEAAPEEHRGWEWRHLHSCLDSPQITLRTSVPAGQAKYVEVAFQTPIKNIALSSTCAQFFAAADQEVSLLVGITGTTLFP
jgi:serine/threonine protein kinase